MSLLREWASWIVLLGVGLMPAASTTSFAAEPCKVQPPAPSTAPAAVPSRPQPAKNRQSLLGALAKALRGDEARNARKVEALRVDDANVRNVEAQLLPQIATNGRRAANAPWS